MKPLPPTRAELAFYAFCRGAVVGFCRLFWRLRVDGRENVPEGAFVLAPVHRSNIDTPLVGAVTRRRLRYVGKDTMWKYRPTGWLFSALGGFGVNRAAADRDALRRCEEVLAGGEPLVLFPEGARQSGPTVQPLKDGPSWLAIRSGVPIVPVGIGGSERAMPKGAHFLRPVRVHIVIGPPLYPPSGGAGGRLTARRELTDQLRQELQRLFDEAQRLADA
ncbi:MAG: lysophospholipid acyltransferase family protein [Acidimicrobiales bacterium]